MLDYLETYGHVLFSEAPVNDVDLLIFSQLAYMDFETARPEAPLSEALAQASFAESADPSEARFAFQKKDDRRLALLAASCPRYAALRFAGFVRRFDPAEETQFACLSLRMDADTLLLAFRGTDNTLAGWKEDFNLAFMDSIPAQRLALAHAQDAAGKAASLLLAGHSKGGNLALYAASFLPEPLQKKVSLAVSFDGPGLNETIIASEGFRRMQGRMRAVLPRSSLVGRLFEQPESVKLIESRVFSVLQHYPYFWKTRGMGFLYSARSSRSSVLLSGTVRGLMARLSPPLRQQLVEAAYEILISTEADTFNGLVSGWRRSGRAVLARLARLDPDSRRLFIRTGLYLLSAAAEALSDARETGPQ